MSVLARIEPVALASDQQFMVIVEGATQWAGLTVEIEIHGADDVESMWLSSMSLSIDQEGQGSATHPGIAVDRETSVWVTAIGPQGDLQRIETVALSLIGSAEPVQRDDIVQRHRDIENRRQARYRRAIGSPGEGLVRFRVAYLARNLYVTRRLDARHGTVHPLPEAVSEADVRTAVNSALEMLGWPTRVNDATWETHMRRNDIAVIEFPEVWASDWDDAYQMSATEAERYLAAIAYLRHAAPTLAMVVLEREGTPITSKLRNLQTPYKGNLAGGPFAGESQSWFRSTSDVLESHPKVALYVGQYLDAQRETETNARYFKLWSVLESIALNRVPPAQRVLLDDGTPWPNGETTTQAAPRVFELVRSASLANRDWPGGDLYTFIRAAYGRRNATAHYGRYAMDDPVQQSQKWYPWAQRTEASPDGHPGWIWELEQVVHEVVGLEVRRAISPENSDGHPNRHDS